MSRSWLSQWWKRFAKVFQSDSRRTARQVSRQRYRLGLELLEDRTVPSVFLVNELPDTHAINLVTGQDQNGLVSLRSAIEAANQQGGNQTIGFDPNVFATRQTITLSLGLLDLNDGTGTITIQGPNLGVTLSGNHATEVFRVEAGTAADLSGLTISNGMILGDGGGIFNAGSLSISESTISGNTAAMQDGPTTSKYFNGYGGGIFNHGSLTIQDSTISGNTAVSGAGIYNDSNGTLTLTSSTVHGNTAYAAFEYGNNFGGFGGGIANRNVATITNAVISGNTAWAGGGLYNNYTGQTTIRDSVITGNAAINPGAYTTNYFYFAGGGVFNWFGTVTIQDSTLSNNSASTRGGAVFDRNGVTAIDGCTLSNNSADIGGGLCSMGLLDPVTLTNTTIADNTATWAGAIWISGQGHVAASDCTIADNSAQHAGGIDNANGTLTLNNSIIAGNLGQDGNGDIVGTVVSSSVNNLIGDGTGINSGLSNGVNGNLVGTHTAPINPLLGPLANNGGQTQTMALLPGSPAINAGSNAAIPAGVATDQRGQPRVVNGIVDIGAYESQFCVFVVNELADTHAVNLTTGTDASGLVSLRSAIEAADHLGGTDVIQFDPRVFGGSQTITLTLGVLTLKDSGGTLTILGPAAGVTISGNHSSEVFRVNTGTIADLTGLTITGGKVTGWSTDYGGGIYNNGNLTITSSTICNNTALTPSPIELFGGYGGGIYNNATLTITNSVISGNTAGGAGAGIDNSTSGTLTLTNCTVSNNTFASDNYGLVGSGGGICNGGTATVTGCTISGNNANHGGGILTSGTLTLANSSIVGNTSITTQSYQGGNQGAGGGLFNSGTATLLDSTISGNTATGPGSGVVGGGICGSYAGTTDLTNCTISNNSASYGGAVGCMVAYSSSCYDPIALTNCTVSGNKASHNGGGIYVAQGDDVTLLNSTLAANTAGNDGGGVYLDLAAQMTSNDSTISGNTALNGGGVYVKEAVSYVPTLTINNTIIAGNTSHSNDGDLVGAVCSDSANNLIGDGDGILGGIGNNGNGNQIGTGTAPINPLLGPLAYNGGSTQTMALLLGSPVIDTGSDAAIPAGVTTDQRGQPRVVNGTVDIGAFEASFTDQAPSITSGNAATFVVGQAGSFTVNTTGFPAAVLSECGPLPLGLSFIDNHNGTASLCGTPIASANGSSCAFTILASNGSGAASQSFTLTLNQAPTITSAASTTFVVGQANSFTFTAAGFPAPSLTKTGTLPAGLTFTNNGNGTATLSGTPTASSASLTPYSFTVTASNGIGAAVTQTFKLTISQAPAITSAASTTFVVGQAGSFTVRTTGLPVGALSETGGLPAGLSWVNNGNGTATLHGTPTAGSASLTPYTFTIQSSNSVGTALQTFNLTVNQPPKITSAASATFIVGQAGSFTVTTTGFPMVALSKSGTLPAGVTFTDNHDGTATISGTPLAGSASLTPYGFTISAGNGIGIAATQIFNLTIDQAPAITSVGSARFIVGQSSSVTIRTTGFPNAALSDSGALPAGVTFTDNHNGTATLKGTPAAGSASTTPYSFTIQASNNVSAVTQTFALTISQAPKITSAASATFVVGQASSFTITTTGCPVVALSKSGTLPTGLTFTDNGNGTATLSGTPAAGTASGTAYSFTVTAGNGVGSAVMQSFKLTIKQPPSFTSAASTTFTAGKSNSFAVKVAGGVPTATTFSVSGKLPSGVSLSSSGVLSGTPAAGSGGVYSFTINASNGLVSTQSFTLTVVQAPAITSLSSATFVVGQPSTFAVTTTGFPAAALTVTGTLPVGLTWTDNGNGTATLSGTPAVGTASATPYSFAILANNGIGSATQSFKLTIE